MLAAHLALAVALIAVALGAAAWGGFAVWRNRPAGRTLAHLLALAQTLLVAQVGLGLLLLSDERRAPDRLHYVYGTLALMAVLSPWIYAPAEPRRRLVWFAGATLLAGALAVRALTTGG
jgi:ABC-type spermidine/putrescine transport system permease subunit II